MKEKFYSSLGYVTTIIKLQWMLLSQRMPKYVLDTLSFLGSKCIKVSQTLTEWILMPLTILIWYAVAIFIIVVLGTILLILAIHTKLHGLISMMTEDFISMIREQTNSTLSKIPTGCFTNSSITIWTETALLTFLVLSVLALSLLW